MEDIYEKIVKEELKPGDKIPTENELIEMFGVSRITVRQAIKELVNEGFLIKKQGRGTFVTQPNVRMEMYALTGFFEDLISRGINPKVKVISMDTIPAIKNVAENLKIKDGDPVLCIERVINLDGVNISHDFSYLPISVGKMLKGDDVESTSIFKLIEEKTSYLIGEAEYSVQAVPASKNTAKLMEIAPGEPILLIKRITYAQDSTPLDYEVLLYRGENFRYVSRLKR